MRIDKVLIVGLLFVCLCGSAQAVDYVVTFVTDGTAGATLDGSTSQTVTSGEDCTTVTATAPSGYAFVNWGNGATTVTTAAIAPTNVTAATTYTAAFIQTYTITFIADTDGYISGDAVQIINSGSNCTTVTAVPGGEHNFVTWTLSDTSTTSSNPLLITNVTSDETYTASFIVQTPTPVPTFTPVATSTPTPAATATPVPTATVTPTPTPTGFIPVSIRPNRSQYTENYISSETVTTTNSAAVSSTFAPAVPFYLKEIRTYIGPSTLTTGTITISVDSGTTATANLILDTLDMSSALYDLWQPTNPLLFNSGSAIVVGATQEATTVTRTTEIIWCKP